MELLVESLLLGVEVLGFLLNEIEVRNRKLWSKLTYLDIGLGLEECWLLLNW